MLKWLVTGREGGGCEDQAGVTDDPLATLAGEISENIYNVNRYIITNLAEKNCMCYQTIISY